MRKTLKIVSIGVGIVIAGYASYFIFAAVKYSHSLDWDMMPKRYLYFFKDSVLNSLDTNYNYSYIQKGDTYNHYIYRDKYYITIWEFRGLKFSDWDIPLELEANLENLRFKSGETINIHSSPEITIKYGFKLKESLKIALNKASQIDSTFKTSHYKGFYGKINKMLLMNEDDKPQVLFDYSSKQQYGLPHWRRCSAGHRCQSKTAGLHPAFIF
ncbi:MAG TPA: hypothetical protein VHA52_01495 [Candidatus Babeliaceae bacterium]|nr:hypothetical protein [Candidatus Babeliaceae bacterium]